ncbi:SpoIIE family protein phosphatase [Miltoncostaea oceani]|uniref:SpoIIE family protein phosphatase n=1 Tax=Miltoncostaea oceani TaxID=2843216 RepID=UPI001C3C53E9|nr:SpoIIE family protein phosphatase [Miltoncostaea oceani]
MSSLEGPDPAGVERIRTARQRLLTVLIVITCLVAVVVTAGVLVSRQINREATNRFVEDAIPLQASVDRLVLGVVEEQSGVRGYIISGDPGELVNAQEGRQATQSELRYISGHLAGHPDLAALVERVRPQIRLLQSYFDDQSALVASGRADAAAQRLVIGVALAARFRTTADEMVADTEEFVRDAKAAQDSRSNLLTLLLVTVGGCALLLVGVVTAVVPRGAARLLGDLEGERAAADRAEARTAVLQELTAALAVAPTVSDVAQVVLEQGLVATGASAGSVAMVSPGGDSLRTVGLAGYPEEIVGAFGEYPLNAALPAPDCIREGPIFMSDSAAVVARYPDLERFHRDTGHEAVASLPLCVEGRPIGGLTLSYPDAQRFGEADRAFLRAVTDLSAQTLDRARLYDNERRDAERQHFLAEAGVLLTSSLDARATLAALTRLAVPRLADWCSVSLPAHDSIDTVAVAHKDPARIALVEDLVTRFPAQPSDETGAAAVLRTGLPEFTPVITDALVDAAIPDEELRSLVKGLGLISAMTVPITARGRTLGVLSLASSESGRHFDAEDLSFAQDVAGRAGLAIDNVLLYQRAQHIATTLQNSLLPSRLPTIPGVDVAARFRAAGEGVEVGGDFYDLFALPGDSGWAAVLGDVCGKGPEAASLTALARYTVRAEADAPGPAEVLSRVNQAIISQRGDGRFLTMACVWMHHDTTGLRARIGRGGHTPSLVVRSDRRVEALAPPGTLVGVFPGAEFEETDFALAAGDCLVLYSDGVTESRSPSGEFFGTERLIHLLRTASWASAADLAERIESACHSFGNGRIADDLALLVISVSPS